MNRTIPGWLIDAGLAVVLALVALAVERWSEGRLFTRDVLLWVGGGSFLLLRLGDLFARAGRTLGCLFVFAMTWLLPCAVALYFTLVPARRAVLRDSLAFFVLLGFVIILIMVVTFERMRVADVARFAGPEEA